MRDDLPSVTACVVAWARVAASTSNAGVIDPRDAVSCGLLPAPFRIAADGLVRGATLSPRLPPMVFAASMGLFDHVVLRTAAIDDALTHAVAGGIDQVVLLGAGLDARAHRLEALHGCTVFEVDHPATQAFKKRRARKLPISADRITYVSVDFERDDLQTRLRESGFDPTHRSFWIWEGVTPYLHREAIEATLHNVRALLCTGSELVATYVTNESSWMRQRRRLSQAALRVIGEPLRTQLTPQAARDLVTAVGLTVVTDTKTADWHRTYTPTGTQPPKASLEHIIHVRL